MLIALCHSFLRTLHTNRIDGLNTIYTRKRIERLNTRKEGGGGLGTETCVLSLRRPVTAGGGSGGPAGLQPCKAPGVWVCPLKVFFHTQ